MGTISSNNDVDVYQIFIPNPAAFSATALLQLGYLTTSKVTDPPGYGLPEWGDGPGPALGLPASTRNGTVPAERNGDMEELAER